jgi:hypothetical protein
MAPALATYELRDPSRTALYKVIANHLETFLASLDADPDATGRPAYSGVPQRRWGWRGKYKATFHASAALQSRPAPPAGGPQRRTASQDPARPGRSAQDGRGECCPLGES